MLKDRIKAWMDKLLGIWPITRVYYGITAYGTLRLFTRTKNIRIVLDVGANTGQSVCAYRILYPNSTIYAFEPFNRSYQTLSHNCRRWKNVKCFQLAMGSHPETIRVPTLSGTATTNSLIFSGSDHSHQTLEDITVTTIDEFSAEHRISRIDFLKIDTEGFDLSVLHGCQRLLQQNAIGFIEVETTTSLTNPKHVALHEIQAFLGSFGYHILAIHDQKPEWNGAPRLRLFNALFTSDESLEASNSRNR